MLRVNVVFHTRLARRDQNKARRGTCLRYCKTNEGTRILVRLATELLLIEESDCWWRLARICAYSSMRQRETEY